MAIKLEDIIQGGVKALQTKNGFEIPPWAANIGNNIKDSYSSLSGLINQNSQNPNPVIDDNFQTGGTGDFAPIKPNGGPIDLVDPNAKEKESFKEILEKKVVGPVTVWMIGLGVILLGVIFFSKRGGSKF